MLFPYPETSQKLSAKAMNFQISVRDPNLEDLITVRWVANYPLYVQNSTNWIGDSPPTHLQVASDGGDPILSATSPDLTCDKFPSSTENNLVVIVSDRGFTKKDAPIPDQNYKYSYKDDGVPTQSLVMMGWRITGCNM
jgi:hypothetical protein